jgi:hypothetical protein
MKNLEKIIEIQDEYIHLLGEELNELVVLAHIHGWESKRYEDGKKLREEILRLKNE